MSIERILGQDSLSSVGALGNFVEALKVAETSARQLALVREQGQWLLVAARLEEIRGLALALAQARHRRLEHRWIS
jgi:hypothetical protein